VRPLNIELELERIPAFIRRQTEQAGLPNLVVGLSGGIDSSLAAALGVIAVGAEHVLGVMLPYRESHPDSLAHAQEVAAHLGINHRVIDISPMVDAYFAANEPDADPLRRGNRKARERMCVLFDLSAKHRALVVGTGNKSELLWAMLPSTATAPAPLSPSATCTRPRCMPWRGASACRRALFTKAPTADLWHGQTDEDRWALPTPGWTKYSTISSICARRIPPGFPPPNWTKCAACRPLGVQATSAAHGGVNTLQGKSTCRPRWCE
jgi:NAD+ synthase